MKLLTALFVLFSITLSAQTYDGTTEWDDYFMPGAGYKTYTPKNSDSLGTFQGFVTEFIIYAKAKETEGRRRGPGRVKTFTNLSIMKSNKEGVKDIFFSNFGLNLSFEGAVQRKFLIPMFGLEIGGLYSRNFSTFHSTPTAGLQLISNRRMLWTAYGGYQYTTKRFDEYSGFVGGSTLNVLLWNN